jgi:hypothetical protein
MTAFSSTVLEAAPFGIRATYGSNKVLSPVACPIVTEKQSFTFIDLVIGADITLFAIS